MSLELQPKALSLRDAVGVARDSLSPGSRYPNQPVLSKGSTESSFLTYWWGATTCPPEMNDIAVAEMLIIEVRLAAIREMSTNSECQRPSLQKVLELAGESMALAPESTPHANTMVFSSTFEGAQPLAKFASDDSVDAISRKSFAKVQTGSEIPLRSTRGNTLPDAPWPKTAEVVDTYTGVAVRKVVDTEC